MKNFLPLLLLALLTPASFASPRPNIILIMGDDMGISDLGCYGGEIDTPNLDKLAKNGLRFTQFYNTARCCPTRASLLSGLYPHQAGVGHMMDDRGHDGYRGEINRSCLTIAEALKTAGYGTYMAGKWHITKSTAADGPKDNWPRQRGFDRFYGTIHGAGSLWDPNSLTRENTQLAPDNDPEYTPGKTWFYTDAIGDQTSRFIQEHTERNPDQPFFSYVSFTAAHWPMHARDETITKYKGKYDAGYGALRASRFAKMKELGIIGPDTEMSPHSDDWEKVKERDWEIRNMEVYAAMVDEMDQAIGKIVDTVDKAGKLDNTLIFFLQDNGGCAEGYGRGKDSSTTPRADKPSLPPMAKGELQMHMQPRQTRDGYPVRTGPGVMAGPADTYIGYGRGWANVSNTPFREYKHWVHEGGISTPLIAFWPAGITRSGELDHQPGHLIDIMATAVDLAGVDYPKEREGKQIKALEGRSLDVAFKGKTIERDAIFWEHEGNCAIRKGDWKLVRKASQKWELYDISKDRPEMHNLAAEKPDLAKKLAAEFEAYADRADVSPVGTWRGNRQKKQKQKTASALNPHLKPDRSGVDQAAITREIAAGEGFTTQMIRPLSADQLQQHAQQQTEPKAKQQPAKPKKVGPMTQIADKPGLPRVLIIGDSISIAYTLQVRELLKDKANVHRPPTNCASTKHGLESIDKWLGDGKWDVIHFNWGLHDLKYLGPKGQNLADPKEPTSAYQVSPQQYEKNLSELVARLKKTGAELIWRNTTPVPAGAKGRVVGDSAKYNEIAKKIMEANDIPIDDLFELSEKNPELQRKADVHYTPEGSKKQAAQVAKAIEAQLK